MANEVNIYTPRYLAEVVKQNAPVHTFFRDKFFTNKKTFSTERIDLDIVKGDRRMAAFVHPRVGGEVLKGQGYSTESYKPPLINPYDITTADQLMNRLPGEDLYSGKTPAQRAAEKLVDEYSRLNDATTRREEWMAVQAIVTGQIPVVGKGVNETISFGFTNTTTLSGTAQWGKSACTILKNLRDWHKAVRTNGFANCDTVIMGSSAWEAFSADAAVMAKLDNRRYEAGSLGNERELPNGVTYHGHLNDPSVDIYEYNEVYLDDWTDPSTPAVKPLVPNGAVIMISSKANYMLAYGACTYIEDNGQWVTAESDRVLRSYVEHHPDRRMLEVQARPLPVPDKADSWYVATVC